jgi:uncharacterized iron-regulated membrane protein
MFLKGFVQSPRQVWLRRALFQIHLWVGIGAGLYIFVVCTSGAALVFRPEIQRKLYPNLFYSTNKTTPPAEIATAVEKIKAAYSDNNLLGLEGPAATHDTFLGYIEKDEKIRPVFANRETGEVLGLLPQDDWLRWVQDLHFYLLAGRTGLFINGIGGMFLLVLCITGLVIWWPGAIKWRRSFTVDFRKNWKRVTWDLHSATGIWSVLLIGMFAVTGVYFAFPQYFRTAVNWVSPVTASPRVVSKPAETGQAPPDVRRFVSNAQELLPHAKVTRVSLPTTEKSPFTVVMSRTEAAEFENENYVYFYFDQFTGELLYTWDRGGQTPGDLAMSWLGFLHVGNFGGVFIKVVWVLFGLAPPLLFLTGAVMWWNRVLVGAVYDRPLSVDSTKEGRS